MPVKNQFSHSYTAIFFWKLLKQMGNDGSHSPFALQHLGS